MNGDAFWGSGGEEREWEWTHEVIPIIGDGERRNLFVVPKIADFDDDFPFPFPFSSFLL